MLSTPAVLGIAGAVLSLADPVPYVREILSGRTRPHRGTWLVWSVLAVSALLTQPRQGATWTVLLLGIQAASTTLIFGLSVRRGVGGTRPGELLLAGLAVCGAAASVVLGDGGTGVLLVVLADAGGVLLMLPKTWRDPRSECWQSHLLAGTAGACAVAATLLQPGGAGGLSLVYPVYFTAACLGLGGVVLLRRGRHERPEARRTAGADTSRRAMIAG